MSYTNKAQLLYYSTDFHSHGMDVPTSSAEETKISHLVGTVSIECETTFKAQPTIKHMSYTRENTVAINVFPARAKFPL